MIFTEDEYKNGSAQYERAKANLSLFENALSKDGFLSNQKDSDGFFKLTIDAPKDAAMERQRLIDEVKKYENAR
jgi:hypothetical protein